jgi:hypothetical protein
MFIFSLRIFKKSSLSGKVSTFLATYCTVHIEAANKIFLMILKETNIKEKNFIDPTGDCVSWKAGFPGLPHSRGRCW